MKSPITFVAALLLALALGTAPTLADPLPSIFTGHDLSGWVVPENNLWWKAADGILAVQSDPEKTASTLWTEREYTNFVLELEFKFGEGTVDSGVFLRAESEQIQIGISGSLKRDLTASPYIAGKGYPVEAEGVAELLRADNWNAMTIVAKGPHYSVWLNGRPVMNYTSETAPKKGPVGLQLHGNRDMAIEFRNLRLAELH